MKIALIENFGFDFYSARLRYAFFLEEQGHEVIAIIPNDGYADKIREHGVNTITIDIHRRNSKTIRAYYKGLKKSLRRRSLLLFTYIEY